MSMLVPWFGIVLMLLNNQSDRYNNQSKRIETLFSEFGIDRQPPLFDSPLKASRYFQIFL